MLNLDKEEIDKLLHQLEQVRYIDSKYKFYKINNEFQLLGRGSFSYVYEMYDSTDPKKRYAAKILGLGDREVNPDIVTEEARLQYSFSEQNDNIIRVVDLWTLKLILDDDGNLKDAIDINQQEYLQLERPILQIILMEKLDSILLKDKYGNANLLKSNLNAEEDVINFAKQIGKAIFTVHNNGYLHRDIKLENIFWDENQGQYKLGDFGIAKYIGEGDAETVVFTDGYGAPEIEQKLQENYNVTADIYSFGVTLYLLLNNLKFPSSDGYHVNYITQYTSDFVFPAPENASEQMSQIIRKMCSYRSRDRFQSIEEVLMEIGRIDGSYGDGGFIEEFEDFETIAYTESDEAILEPESNIADDPYWLKKPKELLTRQERKRLEKIDNDIYSEEMIKRLAISSIIFFALFICFSYKDNYVLKWDIIILPALVLVESILKRVKVFQIEFGILTVAVALYSIYTTGVTLQSITAILVCLLGIPSISAGCSIGCVLWTAQVITGKLPWLMVLRDWDIGWIAITATVAIIESCIMLNVEYNKEVGNPMLAWQWILDKIWYVLIIVGVVLLILEHFKVLVIPEILKHIHLVRTGIGIFLVLLFYVEYYGLYNKGKIDDEFMDSRRED